MSSSAMPASEDVIPQEHAVPAGGLGVLGDGEEHRRVGELAERGEIQGVLHGRDGTPAPCRHRAAPGPRGDGGISLSHGDFFDMAVVNEGIAALSAD